MERNDAVQTLRQNGAATKQEIADTLDEHPNTVDHHLKQLMDAGKVDRERDGRSYTYFVPEDDEDEAAEVDEEANEVSEDIPEPPEMDNDLPETVAPVDRSYNWEQMVPDSEEVYEYIPSGDEWEHINAKVDARYETGQEPAFMLGGPTGCGKTSLAEWMAHERGLPTFTLQMTYDMSPAALLGKKDVQASGDGGTESVWNDGPLTKALLASRERPVVLIIDEANRARPEVHSTLMSALDSRCEVTLDQRGGETVKGIRQNLIVISTINPKGAGDYHGVQDLDFAVKRRLSNAGRYDVDYLGINFPNREADLIQERTPAGPRLSDLLVETANQIREQADDATSEVSTGIPTSTLISVAQSAYALRNVDNPVETAFQEDGVEALYDTSQSERSTVSQIVKDNLDGCPFSEEDVAEWSGEVEYVNCENCEYRAPSADAEDAGVLDFMECPECGSHVVYE